jgi:hypothetical protein
LDEILIPGRDDPRDIVKQFIAHYDAPAYMRRARAVQDALDGLLGKCRQQREAWLQMVRIEMGRLHGLLAGDWCGLAPLLAEEEEVGVLRRLHANLYPRLRMPVAATSSTAKLRRSLGRLTERLDRFNRRWREFMAGLDLASLNEVREGYNRYYLVEKECALRSPRLAREGFCRLEPLTAEDVLALLPPLPVPQLRK